MVADFIVGVFAAQRAGAMAHTTDAVRTLIGREPTPFTRFAHDHAALFGAVPAGSLS
jgi:hypothetical protein